jgi:hypothetical protein
LFSHEVRGTEALREVARVLRPKMEGVVPV